MRPLSLSLFLCSVVPVQNVTACYLFTLCDLCGVNPVRGVCQVRGGVGVCNCVTNTDNPSQPYSGEFCTEQAILTATPSIPSRWTPIVIGVLAGLAGLFCAITCCLLGIAAWRRRRYPPAE